MLNVLFVCTVRMFSRMPYMWQFRLSSMWQWTISLSWRHMEFYTVQNKLPEWLQKCGCQRKRKSLSKRYVTGFPVPLARKTNIWTFFFSSVKFHILESFYYFEQISKKSSFKDVYKMGICCDSSAWVAADQQAMNSKSADIKSVHHT